MAKKRRVPEVLWRLFRDQPQTLAHTIISLMPQSSSSNLHRTGDVNPMSFLLRPDDPSDYRSLLDNCFVVVNDRAPPLLDFSPENRWSQKQIVARTIEMIMSEKPMSPNVICSGFDQGKQSSRVVELLTCSAWDLLLQRAGDSVMVYILKYTSIFLPVSPKKHHQVAGPPITEKSFKLSKLRANFQCQLPSYVQFGPLKKRKRVDNVSSMLERQQASSSASVSVNSSTIGIVGCNGRSYLRQFSEHPKCNSGQMSCFGAATPTTGAVIDKCTDGELQQRSNHVAANPRKRFRPFSWQRSRNLKQKYTEESSDRTPCTDTLTHDKSFRGRLQYDFKNRMQEKCSCLLILQPSQLVSQRDHINRHPMFYSLECSSTVLPRKHILNSLKPNYADSQLLIVNIFGLSDENVNAHSMPCTCGRGFCLIGSPCLYRSLVKLMKILIRRSQHCQHMRLLDKHCAVPSLDKRTVENSSSLLEGKKELGEKGRGKSHGSRTKHCNKILEVGDSHAEAIKPYCSKNQVVSFIWAVCRSIIPADLLGTPSNWRILRRNISKFIRLRRFEKFSTKHCMQNLKTSVLPFLSNKHSLCFLNAQVLKDAKGQDVIMQKEFGKLKNAMHNLKYNLLKNWIFWFFSCLVVPLVQANFYVTESEHGKQDIYYYRKSVWEMLTNKAITCLKAKSYHHLDDADVRCIIGNRPFGFSKLRLCPKENGVRMLANLKASSKMLAVDSCLKDTCPGMKNTYIHHKRLKFDHFKSVNSVLRDTHAVLKGLLLKEPDKLGSSVFDYNDVYRKLCPFLIGLKNGLTTIPDVFIVVSDVSKAFDSIDQDKLLDVMKDVVLKDRYLLERSHQVVCTKKSLSVHENLILMDHNIYPCYTRFTSSLTFPSLHSILVNQVQNCCVRREKILFLLNELVKRNVMQLNKKFYQQGIGIPQGSVLSSLLCSLYYGDLERNVIYPFLEKTRRSVFEVPSGNHNSGEYSRENTIISSPSNILLRFIDDFIFISTSKEQATSFFYRLHRGFQDYNCYMNEEKFCVNFDIGNKSRFPSNRLYVGEDGISFLRWSGLLVNSSTLEVQGDYTRYLNNHLRSTLTVRWQGKPDHDLKMKLQCFVRPKCHPIFFDSNINSADVVRLNIYQVFLLCAMKFHCYVSELSSIWKLCTRSYLKIIERSLRYLHMLIKKRMQSVNLGPNFCPVLQLEEGEVEWLGLNAYVQVLKRKQSRHKELLSLLRCKLSAHRITGNVSCPMNYAIDKTHSSSIWKIKY